MKYTLLFFFLLFSVKGTFAECGFAGISVFPAADTIKQNPVFILTGGLGSSEVVFGLHQQHSVSLRSKTDTVHLVVKEILVGEFFDVQAILVPFKALKTGEKYVLHIDNLDTGRYGLVRESDVFKIGKYEWPAKPVTYFVAAGKDVTAPVVNGMPVEVAKTLHSYGCGPDTYVKFTNTASDDAEMMVRATVKSLQSGIETSFYIPLVRNKIWIGRHMCGGAFDFMDGLDYEVSFTYMDAYGNKTICKGDPVKFTKPTVESPPNWRREGDMIVEIEEE